MRTKKIIIVLSITIFSIIISGEILLRVFCGLTHAPLYQESKEWEYMTRPNQDGYRFGHHYHFNSFGQRSEEPDSSKTIILGLGDSVLFGGMMIDQDSTSTYIFNQMSGMQMLNISSGSWGPDNCAAYLNHYGIFGAKAMFLLVSSHDAHDNMDFGPVVGRHIYYPNKQFQLAWSELYFRYLLPKIEILFLHHLNNYEHKDMDPDQKVLNGIGGIHKNGSSFNPGFLQLKQIANIAQIPLIICLHPEAIEVEAGKYNEQGQEIIKWCKNNNVSLIQELDEGIGLDMYRDGIHTNEKGNRFEARLMYNYLLPAMNKNH